MHIKAEIIAGCLKNERKMQQELYKTCYGIMMGVCYRYVNSTEGARELTNMAFLKVLTNLAKYDSKYPFDVWLRKITTNVCIDDFRKNKSHKAMLEYRDHNELHEIEKDFDLNEAEKQINAGQIKAAMEKLPDTSRKVFVLFAIEGYSHKEIAEQLKMSEGTSKWHVNLARTRLKEMLLAFMNTKPAIAIAGITGLILLISLYITT